MLLSITAFGDQALAAAAEGGAVVAWTRGGTVGLVLGFGGIEPDLVSVVADELGGDR